MPDPIIQPPTEVVSDAQTVLDNSATEREAFFERASNLYEGKPAQDTSSPQLESKASVSPPAAPAAPKPPALQQDKPSATSPGKVPGPPKASEAKTPEVGDEDLPRTYEQGKIRKPHWEKLHSLRDAAVAKAQELEAKVLQYETQLAQGKALSPEQEKKLSELQQQNQDLLQRLEAVAAERSPRFEAAFKPRMEAAISLAKSAVGPALAEKVATLLSMPDNEFRNTQLEELASGLGAIKAGKLSTAIAEMDKLSLERQMYAQKGHELWNQWQTEEKTAREQEKAALSQKAASTFDKTLSLWQQSLQGFQTKAGDAEHNSKVEARTALAKQIFNGSLPLEDLANASIWASLGPEMAAAIEGRDQKISALEAELTKLKGASPGLGSDIGGEGQDAEPDANLSYADAIAKSVQQAGLMR